MRENFKLFHIGTFLCCLYLVIEECQSERKYFMNIVHPKILYSNPNFVKNIEFRTKQYSRRDPVRYLSVNFTSIKTFDNSFRLELKFFELISVAHKHSVFELQLRGCDFLDKSDLIGPVIKAAYLRSTGKHLTCPVPPGFYSFQNISIPMTSLISNLPITEGRIYLNMSTPRDHVFYGYMDCQKKAYNV